MKSSKLPKWKQIVLLLIAFVACFLFPADAETRHLDNLNNNKL